MNATRWTAAATLLLAGCATAGAGAGGGPAEHVDLRLDPAEWTLVSRATEPGVTFLEYVPPGETADAWSRFVLVQLFDDDDLPYPGSGPALTECRMMLDATCPGAEWSVLRQTHDDALYEWRLEGCADEPDQHELGRVLRGRDAWARITVTVKGRMDDATREEWLRRLDAARIVPGGPR